MKKTQIVTRWRGSSAARRRLALWFPSAGAGRCFWRCPTTWRSLSKGSPREWIAAIPAVAAVRRAGQCRALAGGDLLDPVQRQVVKVFAGGDPRQQAGGGHAAVDDGRRDRRHRHRLARTAGVLWAEVAVHLSPAADRQRVKPRRAYCG